MKYTLNSHSEFTAVVAAGLLVCMEVVLFLVMIIPIALVSIPSMLILQIAKNN